MEIKSKSVNYNDIQFRSIQEVRWAVFFDLLKIPYEYEKRYFNFDGLFYLPDFYLPKQEFWFEVKGAFPNVIEFKKAQELCRNTGQRVFIAYGAVTNNDLEGGIIRFEKIDETEIWQDDEAQLWCECQSCGEFGIEFDGRADRLACKKRLLNPCPKICPAKDRGHNSNSEKLQIAYKICGRKDFLKRFSDSLI